MRRGLTILVDYHLHTKLCKHAQGEPGDYLAMAKQKGLDEIGFADHMPVPTGYDAAHRMEIGDLEKVYFTELRKTQKKDGNPTVRIGIEADFVPGLEDVLAGVLSGFPFDYVLGSVHFIGDWGFVSRKGVGEYHRRNMDEVFREYFALVREAARTGLFDVMAHLDLIKKYAYFPDKTYDPWVWRTLEVMAEYDLCLEVNSSGLRAPVGEIYPGPRFLSLARRLGIPITLGSDAHRPGEVGWAFDRLVAAVEEAGYDKICLFHKRKRMEVSLH